MMARSPEQLVGKVVYFFNTGRGPHGFRAGKVRRVQASRKGLRSVTVTLSSPDGKYQGQRMKVSCKDLTHSNMHLGVLWYGKIRRLHEWLGDQHNSPSDERRTGGVCAATA